jgi:hypothetical protein
MSHNSPNPKQGARQPGAEKLDDLNNRRDDIVLKMSAMLRRNSTIEIANTVCHVCGRRFSLRFEVETKGRTENASVFRIRMQCQHCQWNAVFYGYLHKDGRYGLDVQQLSADRFFAERQ